MNIFVFTKENYAKYTFQTVFDILGIDFSFVDDFSMFGSRGDSINRPYAFNHQCNKIPLVIKYTDTESENDFLKNNVILVDISRNKLSSIEFINDNVQFESNNKNIHIKIKFDIVKSIFDIISRKEEFESDKRDKYDRYIPDESNLITKPIVNYYISLLFNLIQFVSRNTGQPLLQKWYWPHGENSALCLTHDVDEVDKWSFSRGSLITLYGLGKANFNLFYNGCKHILNSFTKAEENYNALSLFDKIINIERNFKVKSSFYFTASNFNGLDPIYNINSEHIKNIIHRLLNEGFEIGLHGSYNSYNDFDLLYKQKKKLENIIGNDITGIRQHFLRFDVRKTWQIQSQANFKYDTTLGYAHQEGFRAGICFPFYPYNYKDERPFPILEIPLCIMDNTFSDYKKFSINSAFQSIQNILEEVKQYNGVTTILFHPHYFDDDSYNGWTEIYQEILDISQKRDYYITYCNDIAEWWEKRCNLKLVEYSNANFSSQWIYETQENIENISLRIYYPLNKLNTNDINIFGADVDSIDFFDGIIKINLFNIERKLVVKLTGI